MTANLRPTAFGLDGVRKVAASRVQPRERC
jgi:hypothetical protein